MMKWFTGIRAVNILVLLCALCFLAPALGLATGGPRMVLKETTFDFKEVDEGEIIEHSFVVLNQGDQPLQISRVKPG
ncbi:MAG: hypothetical protein DRH20_15565 [Deltaproteobacteria bacterium]|nr:MAG: hypothetical protein DRH20_15565 [Deltaproteobacteria bacterium]